MISCASLSAPFSFWKDRILENGNQDFILQFKLRLGILLGFILPTLPSIFSCEACSTFFNLTDWLTDWQLSFSYISQKLYVISSSKLQLKIREPSWSITQVKMRRTSKVRRPWMSTIWKMTSKYWKGYSLAIIGLILFRSKN